MLYAARSSTKGRSIMAMQPIKKAGNVKITPVGQTTSGHFGSTPDAQVRGRSKTPTEIPIGK